jgi:hypothetical protein
VNGGGGGESIGLKMKDGGGGALVFGGSAMEARRRGA